MIEGASTKSRRCTAALALLGAAWLFLPGCAQSTGGTDSNTHWLRQCVADSECGELSCLCGACTRSCEVDSACGTLSEAATCEAPDAACEGASRVCVLECATDADCPAAAPSCDAGRCVAASACEPGTCDGGAGCEGAACADAGPPGDGGSPRAPCTAMDAQSSGDDCAMLEGFAFDGMDCSAVYCGCVGDDCDGLYASRAACLVDHAHCFDDGPYAYCERDTDCAASERCFAGTCGPGCEDYTQCDGDTRCFAEEAETCLPYVIDVGDPASGPCLARCRNDDDCGAIAPGLLCWGSACVHVPPACELACPKVASSCPAECTSLTGAGYDPALMCRAADAEVLGCMPRGRLFTADDACAVAPDGTVYGGISGSVAGFLVSWGGYTECSAEQFQAHSEASVCK